MSKNKFLPILILLLLSSCKEDKKESNSAGISLQRNSFIAVENPQPGEKITSPVQILGKARGTWFFEGSFAVFLYDEDQNEIAVAVAQAQQDWMTEDWVPFSATLKFDAPESKKGTLVFKKANPTGKAKFDRSFTIRVNFTE